ncbi:uncharacterized protein LOC134530599 isoform X2 [Bacillus rossius redtenbacheri]|uniref:uncharacterized protein LOC134530599 isoform X2 n=1 Tax=Bacillus rossius redtenbacheri TaxID=93214 RepID=UPI002FDDE867
MAQRYGEPGFSDGVKLYVKFLPLECNEDDLYELFSQYGEVSSAKIPQKSYTMGGKYLYGYVTYSSKSDAMDAILELNDTPPYYLTVEVSRCESAELLREHIQTIPRILGQLMSSGLQYVEHTAPVPRRHSTMAHNYKLTSTLDGRRTIRGLPSVEQRRSLPFSKGCGREVQDPLEDDDVPAPGQKQKFPCFKCGNLTFRKCVCGGAYYCKDECRLSDWPEHKPVCLKKLESQPEFQAETASCSLTSPEKGSARSQLGFRKGQIENGIQSQQNVNLSPRQSRFPALDDFASTQTTRSSRLSNVPARNDLDSVQDYKFSDMKESSANQYPNDGSMSNEHGDFTNKQNRSRKNNWDNNEMRIDSHPSGGQNRRGMDGGDNWKEADVKNNHILGQNLKYIQGDSDRSNDNLFKRGGGKKNVSQRDVDIGRNSNQDDSGRNVNQYSGVKSNFSQLNDDRKRIVGQDNGDNRINYGQGDGDNRRDFCQGSGDRKNFNQGSGDRRNLSQGSGDNRRNFCHRDGVKKNFSQDGENRRNFGQHDGDKNKFGDRSNARNDSSGRRTFGSRDNKPFSGGMNEKKGNVWNGKHSEGAAHTNLEENDESWDEPIEKKVEDGQCVPHKKIVDAQSFPQEKVEGIQLVSVEKLQKIHVTATLDSKIPPLGAFTSKDLPAEVAQVLIVMAEGPQTFFVQRLSNGESLKLICEEVVKSPSLPLAKPEIGMLCAAMFEGEWYRACVLSVTPQLTVKYVDYGNVDICDPSELHQLPASIVDLPPVAEKIEVVDASPGQCLKLSEGAVISIKPIEKAKNGILKVTIIDGKSATMTKIDAKTESSQGNAIAQEVQLTTDPLPTEETSHPTASVASIPASPHITNSIVSPSQEETLPQVASLQQAESVLSTTINSTKDEFMKAKITVFNDKTDYWVTWESDCEKLDSIIMKTHENVTSVPLASPKEGQVCCAKYDGIWFRAKITKTEPEVEVHYFDYGNSEICPINDLRELPEAVKDFPPMAFRVKLADGTPPEYHDMFPDSVLSIKIVGQDDNGVKRVQVEGVKYADILPISQSALIKSVPSNRVSSPQQNMASNLSKPSTMSTDCEPTANPAASEDVNKLNVLSKVYDVLIVLAEGPRTFFVQRLSNGESLKFICEEVVKSPSLPLAKPEIGMLCAAMFEGEWYRACVLSVTPQLTVQYVDYGNVDICDPSELHQLPTSIVDLPPVAEKIEVVDASPGQCLKLSEGAVISIKPIEKAKNGILKVTIIDGKCATITKIDGKTESSQGSAIAEETRPIVATSLQAESLCAVPVSPSEVNAASVAPSSCTEGVPPVASAMQAERTSPTAIKVAVVMKEKSNAYFVQRVANNDTLRMICEEVVKSPSLPLIEPEVGKLCASMFEGEWYRAKILMLDPNLAVQYIDYGNVDICDPTTLHELSPSILSLPPMAEKIEFVDEIPVLSDDAIISIIRTGETEKGVMKVRLDGGKKAAVSIVATADESLQGNAAAKDAQLTTDPLPTEETSHPTASVPSIPASPHITNSIGSPSQEETLPQVASLQQAESVLSTTINSTKDEFMKAKITVLNDKTDYWVTWESDCEKLDNIILKTHENVTSVPLASPKEGQVCCAKYDGIWFRAKITKTEPEVEVHYFDYGNSEICPINDLRELPEAVKDFPPMAFRVKLADGTPPEYHDMLPDSVLSIKIVGQDDNGVKRVQVEGVKYADILPMSQSALIKSVPSNQVSSSPQENMASNPSKPSTKSTDCRPTANPAASEDVNKLNFPSKFYDVQISMTLGGNDYWVQRAGMDKELQVVMVEVNEHASKGIKTTPEVGKLCAAQFQCFWYRARITKIAPELEVHFIDFGNTEICTSDILELPSSVKNFTPLALRIQLADGTPAKFSNLPVDSVISIRPVLKTTENITVVRVEGVDYGEGLEENVHKEVASTVETPLGKKQDPGSSNPDFQNTCLKFLTTEGNIGGALHFIKKYSGSYYTVTAVSDASRSVYDQLIELRKSGIEFPADKSFRPVAGDVVLARSPSQGGLCRARVASESSGTYKVVLVDVGIIESVTEVRELPPHLAALPRFAVKCVVTSYYVNEEEFLGKCAKSEDAFIFQVRSVSSSHVTCLVLSITNSPLCSVDLSAWEPSSEEIGVTRVVLRDGDPVRVSFYNGPEDVHVSSLVPEHVQLFATFSETLHAYCIQAGFLQQPPRVGDVLACKFVEDNRFYRCEVRSVTGSFCDIYYLDYGNSEYGVMFNKLKYISEDLKKFACPCLHVSLKGVGSCKMTFELVNFIKKLVDEKVVLRMEKHPDGVVLCTETGVSINERIVGILNNANPTVVPAVASPPISCSGSNLQANATNNSAVAEPCTSLQSAVQNHSSSKADSNKSRIMSSALKHRKFPLGELKLQIFSILKDLSLMACPFDTSAVEATDNLTFTLNDYCSKLPAEPYHPLVDEVCIAKFHADGQWYRAVCLSAAPGASTRKLMFVDYGNVEDVEVTDIRKMDPQFIKLPVLVEKCNIKGVGERNKLVEKIVKEKILTSKLYDIKITKHLPTHYEVEIGLVTAALQAEGIYVEGI